MLEPSETTVTMAEPATMPSSNSASQSTIEDVDTSPSTQLDAPSSQSQDAQAAHPGNATHHEKPAVDGKTRRELRDSNPTHAALVDRIDSAKPGAAPRSPARTGSALLATESSNMAGHKRMASGSVKPSSTGSRAAGASAAKASSTSADVISSHRIGELSAQLSARLSYAFVKVQHGWETRSLDEVEILAEQQQKARSPAMRHGHGHGHTPAAGSSRAGLAGLSRESSGLSDTNSLSSSLASDQETRLALRGQAPGSRTQTYESFWRDHGSATKTVSQILEAQRTTTAPTPPTTGSAGLTTTARLAPSAPIVSSSMAGQHSRRRKAPARSRPQPPELPHIKTANGTGDLGALASARSTTFPATPPPPSATSSRAPDQLRTPGPRTPSEKAAMEQDAVETLLFMSSPAHSHHSHHLSHHAGNQRKPPDYAAAAIGSPPPTSTTPTRDRRVLSPALASPQGRRQPHQRHRSAHHAALRRVILDASPGHDDSDDNDVRNGPRHRRPHAPLQQQQQQQQLSIPMAKLTPTHTRTRHLQVDGNAEDEIDKMLDAMSSEEDRDDDDDDDDMMMMDHDVDQITGDVGEDDSDDDDDGGGGGGGGVSIRTNGIRR